MKSMYGGKEIPDDEVLFYDGFLYIIVEHRWIEDGKENHCAVLVEKCIHPEFDEPISLADIARDYPDVIKVLHDDWLEGELYSYGNYEKGEWVQYGQTRGFA